jgi:hypothetical protein
MKHVALVIGMAVLIGAAAVRAQSPAPKPGPEQKKLEIWVGDWTYEGENMATPFRPASKHAGKASVRPILGGFFVEWHGEETGPAGTTLWLEIDGYDPLNKKFMWNNFSDDGSFNTVTYTIETNTVKCSGTSLQGEKQYKFRASVVFAPDLMSSVEKGEISVDGKTWMPSYENRWTKIKSSAK